MTQPDTRSATQNPHPERLYYDDAYLTSFEATVTSVAVASDGRSAVVTLDRTAFYPESGGQPDDRGHLGPWPVVRVVEDEATGQVLHTLGQAETGSGTSQALGPDATGFPSVGDRLTGEVDEDRRRDHRQQHAGQHLLSATFEKLFGASTVGFHLGDEAVTIDLDRPSLSPDDARQVEDLTNAVVLEGRPIVAHWMTWDEVAKLPLRKPPTVREGIRVVEVQDFDWSPCGGTHPAGTSQIGMVKIVGVDKVRGNVRVAFVCGDRALRDYRLKDEVVRGLASTLSAPPAELPEAVRRLNEQALKAGKELAEARAALIEYEAEALWREAGAAAGGEGSNGEGTGADAGPDGRRVVVRRFEGRPMAEIKLLAARLAARPLTAAVLGTAGDGQAQVALARSADLGSLDLRPIIKELLPIIGGRGGGGPNAVQGGGPSVAGLDELLGKAEAAMRGV
ncbi:MAG: alanyl-tRNA editing protein [Bacillota bacterium]